MLECSTLPIHPVTGVRALAVLSRGPVWPILGGSVDAGDAGGGDTGDDGGDSSGDGGQQQQEPDWRAEATKWQDLSRKNEARARANAQAAQELARMKAQNQSEMDKAISTARTEAEQNTAKRYTDRLVALSVKAAASKFNDPADAVGALHSQLGTFVTDDGDVDDAAVQKAVEAVLKAKPYLAAKPPPADFDGGQRNGQNQSGSLSMDALIRRNAGIQPR